MELVVAVAIGVLALVFVCSLAALIAICKQRRRLRQEELDRKPILKYSREHLDIITSNGVESDFGDVLQLSPNIAKILRENDWVFDASGLVQHCLSILKLCHQMTDKLSALSFPPSQQQSQAAQDLMDQVSVATRRVMPRVDDLVRTMYVCTRGGAQSPLLEARAAALVMASAALVAAFRAAYSRAIAMDVQWLVAALSEMDGHLEALRMVSQQDEMALLEKVHMMLDPPIEEEEEPADVDQPSTSTTPTSVAAVHPPLPADDDCPADPSTAVSDSATLLKAPIAEQAQPDPDDASACLTSV